MANKMTGKTASKNYMGRNPGRSKKKRVQNRCPICGAPLQMVSREEMGFRFIPKKDAQQFDFYWRCSNHPKCDAYTPADKFTKQPWGRPADRDTRYKRMLIHVWQQELVGSGMCTPDVFRSMCGSLLGIYNQEMVHTRFMTEMECNTVLDYLKKLYENNERYHALVEGRPYTAIWKELHGVASPDDPYAFFDKDGKKIERPPHLCNRDKAGTIIGTTQLEAIESGQELLLDGHNGWERNDGEQKRNMCEQKKD